MTETWTHQFNSEADFLDFLKMRRENEELLAKVKYLEKAVDDYANDIVKKNETIGELKQASCRWIDGKVDTESDGVYLGYIEKHEVCGAINYYQRTVSNRKNKWVLEEGESLLFWKKLGANPINK